MSNVTIVDYSNGNANSIIRALHSIGATSNFSKNGDDIANSDFIILPGVGHAGTAMASLEANGLIEPLRNAVLVRKVPVLGICLGMHLMVDYVEEGGCAGLGWVRGRAVSLSVQDRLKYKVPHIGWNTVHPQPRLQPFSNSVRDQQSFYFCHKYVVDDPDPAAAVASFRYESERIASFQRGNITGVQYHPEKSHETGQDLFRAFLSSGG